MKLEDSKSVDPQLIKIKDCLYRLSAKAIIIENKKLLVVNEYDNDWWSLPGGGIDYGESVQEALKRELFEELGVSPDKIQVDKKVEFVTTHAIVDNIPRAVLFYRAHINDSKIKLTDHVKRFAWYGVNDLLNLRLSPSLSYIIDDLIATI